MKIKIEIKGITPLLCHRFPLEAAGSDVVTPVFKGNKRGTPEEVASVFLYRLEDGSFGFPSVNLVAGLTSAGRFVKSGKSKVTTSSGSLVPACVDIGDELLRIEPQEWEPFTNSVVIPSTGGRVIQHRPKFWPWALRFIVALDEKLFGEVVVKELFEHLGQRVGIGGFRPEKGGRFGRFQIENWKEVE